MSDRFETQNFSQDKANNSLSNFSDLKNLNKSPLLADKVDDYENDKIQIQEYIDNLKLATKNETKNNLEWFKFQNNLYAALDINPNLESNNFAWKFVKWFIDSFVLENIDLIQGLAEKSMDELVSFLKNIDWVNAIIWILSWVFDDVRWILNMLDDPYNGWYALASFIPIWKFFKIWKTLKVETKHIELEWFEKWKRDFLDAKWDYKLDDISNLKPNKAVEKMQDFALQIDEKYLIKNPERLKNLWEIINWISKYVVNNSSKLNKMDDCMHALNDYRKKINIMLESKYLDIHSKKYLDSLKNWPIHNARKSLDNKL